MSDQIKMRTAADIWSDDSGDDYDTDEELAKVTTTSSTSRLKKKGQVAAPLDPEEEKLKMKKKMERAAEKKRKKEEKAARKAQRKKEKRLKREQRKKAESSGGAGGKAKDKKAGYESGDSYDSGDGAVRNADDDAFLDLDDDDDDLIKEYNEDQDFGDERGERVPKSKGKKRSAGGGEKLSGARASDMENPVMQAMSRMKRQRIKAKSVEELEQEAIEFVTSMDNAADTDEQSNKEGKPGVSKLKMMRSVTDTMANTQLMRPLLDYDVLKRVYRWIQPVKGKLGSVTIRRELLTAVGKMTGENGVAPGDLKRSNLGKMAMALYNHPSETKEMKLLLRKLIDQWSRPIFRKSGNYKDLEDAEQERRIAGFRPQAMKAVPAGRAPHSLSGPASGAAVGSVLTSGKRSVLSPGSEKSSRSRVAIPFSKGFSYTVRPADRIDNATEKYMAGTRLPQDCEVVPADDVGSEGNELAGRVEGVETLVTRG
ncbi:hypothetical protein TrRE_jg9306 [Triparma retinervis]|uniref:TFIIS N-terminal domain-containing protein n=1 Tax=Triparma retinervis TaxID=2557542 RepID=A0A9W6ZUT2_9STRA|nr:hypothetical protein TrRE_jg9306 [Triparma retinervis]